MNRRNLFAIVFAGAFTLTSQAEAICTPNGSLFNMIANVCWDCMFPIKIAGVPILGGTMVDVPDPLGSSACMCPTPNPPYIKIGIPITFWEPARIAETVKDPYCFVALGTSLAPPSPGLLTGGNIQRTAVPHVTSGTFAQVHYYIAPLMVLLGLTTAAVCNHIDTSFDIAYMTEVDPLWNDDAMAALINPEALLFGNPLAIMSCMADAISSQVGVPLDPLFWCAGSWGGMYPLTGHHDNESYTEANAGITGRFLFKMGREMILSDTALSGCMSVKTPILIKSHYRLQITAPQTGAICIPIGRSGLIWSWFKNLPPGQDNYSWQIFRKFACCAGLS